MHTQTLLNRYPIISDQISRESMAVVLSALEKALSGGVAGDIAEFGCYIGTTSIFMRRILDIYQQSEERRFYAYDSFAGLPEKTAKDASRAGEQFKGGELTVSRKQFLQSFKKAGLRAPVTIKGWFNELDAAQLPESIAFAFLDGDFYESIRASLELVWPRLSPGAIITIDDYQREALPGVTRAVEEFFRDKPVKLTYAHNIAVITS